MQTQLASDTVPRTYIWRAKGLDATTKYGATTVGVCPYLGTSRMHINHLAPSNGSSERRHTPRGSLHWQGPRTDSTIAPPQNRRCSLTNVSWLLDTKKDAAKTPSSQCFLVCEGLSNDDFGVARGTGFQEIRRGGGFRTGDFVKEKLWGLP